MLQRPFQTDWLVAYILYTDIDDGKCIGAIFLDLKKAFDFLDHDNFYTLKENENVLLFWKHDQVL